jgi:hypothetical protein
MGKNGHLGLWWCGQNASGRFDAIADDTRDSVPDVRIGITPAAVAAAPQKADDLRLT